jgi:hypothetical protein
MGDIIRASLFALAVLAGARAAAAEETTMIFDIIGRRARRR